MAKRKATLPVLGVSGNQLGSQFNESKFQKTKNLGKGGISQKVLDYDEGSNFTSMFKKIKEGR